MDDKNIRFHASKGLKSVNSVEYVDQLIKAMDDEYENVRYWIAIVLGNYSGDKVKAVLNKALKDDSHWVRKYAEDSLRKIEN
jgi:HEAT repeat protein